MYLTTPSHVVYVQCQNIGIIVCGHMFINPQLLPLYVEL
jgi:hypothetical protein